MLKKRRYNLSEDINVYRHHCQDLNSCKNTDLRRIKFYDPCTSLTTHYAMSTYGEVEVCLQLSLPRNQMKASGHLDATAALSPRIEPPVPIGYEAGWNPKLVWTMWRRNNLFPLPEIEPRFLGFLPCSLIAIPIQLSRLQNVISFLQICEVNKDY
jgi:hypothetical protein